MRFFRNTSKGCPLRTSTRRPTTSVPRLSANWVPGWNARGTDAYTRTSSVSVAPDRRRDSTFSAYSAALGIGSRPLESPAVWARVRQFKRIGGGCFSRLANREVGAIEGRVGEAVVAGLRALGHSVKVEESIGATQSIAWDADGKNFQGGMTSVFGTGVPRDGDPGTVRLFPTSPACLVCAFVERVRPVKAAPALGSLVGSEEDQNPGFVGLQSKGS